jgi:hypothetical protein
MKLVIFLNKNGGGAFVKAPEVWTVDDAEFLCEYCALLLSQCRSLTAVALLMNRHHR